MRSNWTAVALLLLLCLAPPARASAGGSTPADLADSPDGKSRIIVPMQSGAFVAIRTESAPSSAGESTSQLVESEDKPNLIHRIFVDRENQLFFGYELLVERAAEARYFWVTVRALSEDYLSQLRARPAFRGRRLHPGYNATAFPASPQFLRDGDTFALDVFQNPRTGTKIVDVIQVTLTDPSQRQAGDAPRDFSPEDVQLKVSDYRLKVNGETVYRSTGGCAGAVIWFSLGDRGRFVFSLVERPGFPFQKVGAVRNNTVAFEWGGDKYEWESSLPVVSTGGNWNLWVLHDPDYKLDLFEQPTTPPPAAASDKSLTQKAEDAARRMKGRNAQAEYGAPSAAQEPQQPGRTRRTRVVIGSADGVEHLFPRQQK